MSGLPPTHGLLPGILRSFFGPVPVNDFDLAVLKRMSDPVDINLGQIAAMIAAGNAPTIQFSKPLGDLQLLDKVDELCKIHADKIEVRFYGFRPGPFDASILSRLPHVQWLSIDCLMRAANIEELFVLKNLRKLSLGIYELDFPEILAGMQLRGLKELRLIETKKNNINLAPLEQCEFLSSVCIGSHTTGFEVLKKLNGLRDLTLRSIPKGQPLAVVSETPQLKKLKIVLGGRADINEISHSMLTELTVDRVRGFSSLGDLGRFPALQKLRVEDQIRLGSIGLEPISQHLRELAVFNCKKLKNIDQLSMMKSLEDLVIGKTSLNLENVMASLPRSLRTVRFWTSSRKANMSFRTRLDALGYKEFSCDV